MTSPRRNGTLRVLHVIDSLGIGGIERNLIDLVQQTRGDVEHDICCIRRGGVLVAALEALGTAVHVLGAASGQTLAVFPPLVRLCRTRTPHIVQAHNWGAVEAVLAARLAGVPGVIYCEHAPHSWPGRLRDVARRAVAGMADAVVTVSHSVRDHLHREVGLPAAKLTVIANGVDAERFRPRADRDALRAARGIPADGLLIGAVGRLDAVKRYDRLIAAFEPVAARHANSHLVLVGDGPERAALQRDIEQRRLQQRVHITGFCDEVETWLGIMDIFAHVSSSEGLSNAILQAMATALPVVASDLGPNRELIVPRVTGRLLARDTADELTEALTAYCGDADARRRHGAAGRQRAQAEYSLRGMIDGYRSLYERVAPAGRDR